jgi:hypothetical protein
MRPESAAWERAAEVRAAARGWREAGAIDDATLDAVNAAFPDPCVRPAIVWRALTAGMVTAVTVCAFVSFGIAARAQETGLQILLFLWGGACVVATELMEVSPRFARRGAAGATSFWAVVLCLAGFGLLLITTLEVRERAALDAVLAAGALAWGAASWRWGDWLFAGFSVVSLFVLLGRLPHGRLLVLVGGAALVALAARRLDDASWAPPHRRAATALVVTGLIAAYAAVNVYSLDMHLLEALRGSPRAPISRPPGLLVLSALGTAALPLAVLLWGIGARRTFLIGTSFVLLALSLITLRYYVHIAPLWAVLTVSGAGLIVLAIAVERALRRAPGGEIAGLTADQLFVDERHQRALQIVPVVATFTPSAPGSAAGDESFTGKGGRFGGGGATEKF